MFDFCVLKLLILFVYRDDHFNCCLLVCSWKLLISYYIYIKAIGHPIQNKIRLMITASIDTSFDNWKKKRRSLFIIIIFINLFLKLSNPLPQSAIFVIFSTLKNSRFLMFRMLFIKNYQFHYILQWKFQLLFVCALLGVTKIHLYSMIARWTMWSTWLYVHVGLILDNQCTFRLRYLFLSLQK